MFAGPIGDYLGRKVTILMGALFFLLGGALQTGARTTGYLFAGRAFAGFGVGFLVMSKFALISVSSRYADTLSSHSTLRYSAMERH